MSKDQKCSRCDGKGSMQVGRDGWQMCKVCLGLGLVGGWLVVVPNPPARKRQKIQTHPLPGSDKWGKR